MNREQGARDPSLGADSELPPSALAVAHEKTLWIALISLLGAIAWLQAVAARPPADAMADPPTIDPTWAQPVSLTLILVLLLGVVLLSTAVSEYSRGNLACAYKSEALDRNPYLETLLLFVVGAQIVGAAAGALTGVSSGLWPLWLNACLLFVPAWPLFRGSSVPDLRQAIGWQAASSAWRELAWGAVAYLASLPILVLGLLMSLAVSKWVGAPYHPVIDWMSSEHWFDRVTLVGIAVLWAPIVEETIFRGALHHYLRGRLNVWGAAVCGGVIFAALHPQGLAGLPFLVTLAVVLAVVREWRGSILACMTMHFIHNGITLTVMAFLVK